MASVCMFTGWHTLNISTYLWVATRRHAYMSLLTQNKGLVSRPYEKSYRTEFVPCGYSVTLGHLFKLAQFFFLSMKLKLVEVLFFILTHIFFWFTWCNRKGLDSNRFTFTRASALFRCPWSLTSWGTYTKSRFWNYQMLQTMFNKIDVFGICIFLRSRKSAI